MSSEKWYKQHFRINVIVLTLCSVLLPLMLVCHIFYIQQEQQLINVNRQQLLETAIYSAQDIERWFQTTKETAYTIANSNSLVERCALVHNTKPGTPQREDAIKALSRADTLIMDSVNWVSEVRLSDIRDHKVYYSNNQDVIGEDFLPEDARFPNDWDVLTSGKALLSQSNDTNFTKVKDDQNGDDSKYVMSPPAGFVSALVYNQKKPVAILTLKCYLSTLETAVNHTNVYLVDQHGIILANAKSVGIDASHFGENGLNEVQRILTPAGHPSEAFQNHIANPKKLSGSLDHPYENPAGLMVIGAWALTDPGSSPHPFIIIAERSCDETFKVLNDTLYKSLRFSGLVALVMCIIAWLCAQRLTSPLVDLALIAQTFAQGAWKVRCNWKRNDEIGQFSRAFDSMADTLTTTMHELEKARDKAMEASRTKSRFLANMSHELRTPLNAIIGYSEMIIEDAEDPDADYVHDVHNIHLSGINLLQLINSVLDMSKIEAGKMTVFVETFSVSELAMEVQSALKPLAASKGNEFVVDIPDSTLQLRSDRTKIRQIINNLLSNAFKFTEKGTVTLSMVSPRQGHVIIKVQDTGIGMSKEQLSKVFQEFTQADDSTSRNYGGTGLGLTLVAAFTEMLKGTLNVESEPGRGTTFTIELDDIENPVAK